MTRTGEQRPVGWVVLVNPVSGRGQAPRLACIAAAEIERAGHPVEIQHTSGPGHASQLASIAVRRGQKVAVCGGDGTLHEVVNGVPLDALTLGIVPAGRGNDFARALGMSNDAREAGSRIARGRTRNVDVGLVGEVRFLTVACVGLDARVAMSARGWAGWGRLAYKLGAVVEIVRGPRPILTVGEGGDAGPGKLLLAAFANGGFYGGGLAIAPDADVADGQLDVCKIGPVGRLEALRLLRQVGAGRHKTHGAVRLSRSAAIEVYSPTDQPIVADGERVGSVPAAIRVMPGALTVVV